MDFSFSVNDIFIDNINKIKRDLLPRGFTGDVRAVWKCESQVCDIVDAMGIASARAQGLQKAITTGEKLRSNDHTLYLLTDAEGNGGKGVVVGLLKVGRKKLFVFDSSGKHHEMEPLCVLDFYIHESMQRMGCGKLLYEHMLKEENIKPEQLAIDRPSEKFLAFLHKHYGLSKTIPQANNFVIFEEFFSNLAENHANSNTTSTLDDNASLPWKTQLIKSYTNPLYGSADNINSFSTRSLPFERHRAEKPQSSIGVLLHHPSADEHSLRDIVTPKCGLFSSGGYASGSGESISKDASSSVIIEPKSVKSIPPLHHQPMKSDLKFSHTPLW